MISRRQIISRSAEPILAVFTSNESFLGVDDRSGPLSRYLKGRCDGNQFYVVSKTQTTCIFCILHHMEGFWVQVIVFFQYPKGHCHGNQICVVVDLFIQSRSISRSAGPFSQSLHHMVGIELWMINPAFFFNILRDIAIATNFVAKLWQNYLPTCTYRSVIPNLTLIVPLIALHRVKRWWESVQ